VLTVYAWHHLGKATDGGNLLAESNGSLLPGGWLKVTCGLTACILRSTPTPMLDNEYGRTLPLKFNVDGGFCRFSFWALVTTNVQVYYSEGVVLWFPFP